MRNAPRLDMAARSARQRARGEIRVAFARAGERSEAARAFETGGLRLRFPHAGAECEAVIVNTGGGMAGGDLARMTLDVGPGARALATTQSAEKVYKADGETSRMEISLSVAAGGSLVWESSDSPEVAWQRIPAKHRQFVKENNIRVFILPGAAGSGS